MSNETTYVVWNPDKVDNYLPRGCTRRSDTVEGLVAAEEATNASICTIVPDASTLSAVALVVLNEFDGTLCNVTVAAYKAAQLVSIPYGMLAALVEAAETSGCGLHYSWNEVNKIMAKARL